MASEGLGREELAKSVASQAVALHWNLEEIDDRYLRGEITREEAKQIMSGCIRMFYDGFAKLVVRELVRQALEKALRELT